MAFHRMLLVTALFCCSLFVAADTSDFGFQQQNRHLDCRLLSSSSSRLFNKDDAVIELRGGGREKDVKPRRPSAAVEGIRNSAASALASCCAKTLLQPFDTIKTIQQHARTTTSASIGFFEATRMVMERDGGFWELYAGLVVSALGR